jgi:hypothetical protein
MMIMKCNEEGMQVLVENVLLLTAGDEHVYNV